MKGKLTTALFAVIFLCAASLAIENPNVTSPVGSGTAPVTSGTSGLIRSPNPFDQSSNRVVTGNVAGGKHFRGVVPYNATTDFSGGSVNGVDKFLRYSAPSSPYELGLSPYYSQTRSVTSLDPGGNGKVLRPPTSQIDYRARANSLLPPLKQAENAYNARIDDRLYISPVRGIRPLSSTLEQLRQQVPAEQKYDYPLEMSDEELAELIRKYQQQDQTDIEIDTEESPLKDLLKEQLKTDQQILPQTQKALLDRSRQTPEPLPEQPEQTLRVQQREPEEETPDVFEQLKTRIQEYQQQLEQQQVPADQQTQEPESTRDLFEFEKDTETETETEEAKDQAPTGLESIPLSVRARAILGEHKTFASYANDNFNRHMRTGEDYLQAGKYYFAADSFTIASMYKPEDPLAYAGKAHALFGAGEYMSSALYLARALNLFPEYAALDLDLSAMFGGRDQIDKRVTDIQAWIDRSDSGELKFLLSYIYYHTGRLEEAQQLISQASQQLDSPPAVAALKKAIDTLVQTK